MEIAISNMLESYDFFNINLTEYRVLCNEKKREAIRKVLLKYLINDNNMIDYIVEKYIPEYRYPIFEPPYKKCTYKDTLTSWRGILVWEMVCPGLANKIPICASILFGIYAKEEPKVTYRKKN